MFATFAHARSRIKAKTSARGANVRNARTDGSIAVARDVKTTRIARALSGSVAVIFRSVDSKTARAWDADTSGASRTRTETGSPPAPEADSPVSSTRGSVARGIQKSR